MKHANSYARRRLALVGGLTLLIGGGAVASTLLDGDPIVRMTLPGTSDGPGGLAAHGVNASGESVTVTRDVPAFNKIEVRGAADLTVDADASQSVELTTDKAYLERVFTTVEDGVLIIDITEKGEGRRINWDGADLDLTIGMPVFEGLSVMGAADATISDIKGGPVNLSINGAGDVSLQGTCDAFSMTINGAGDVDAEDLICAEVSATINGAGEAEIHATRSVTANVNGVGEITVYGKPGQVQENSGFLGKVHIK